MMLAGLASLQWMEYSAHGDKKLAALEVRCPCLGCKFWGTSLLLLALNPNNQCPQPAAPVTQAPYSPDVVAIVADGALLASGTTAGALKSFWPTKGTYPEP
jgi:hypothetical protein